MFAQGTDAPNRTTVSVTSRPSAQFDVPADDHERLPGMPCVYMISTSGCVLQGDRLYVDIAMGPGSMAHVTTQSATKVHEMDANFASQVQTVTLAEHSYLELMPGMTIPLPVGTAPFVFAMWLFLLPKKQFVPVQHATIAGGAAESGRSRPVARRPE